jgi:type I restriction enzyme M protein
VASITETETVVKRILPYMERRGYDVATDITFEAAAQSPERYEKGYVDLLVTAGKKKPQFLVEAKRSGKRLTDKDRKQAHDYAKAHKVLFFVVTNGEVVQVFNTETGTPIRFDNRLADKIPSKQQLLRVLKQLRADKLTTDITIDDESLPFRPGLPLKQLNALFARCHSRIRNIEKNEEHAFSDFSKMMFLKLLEEKADREEYSLPYSYRFWELAGRAETEADQVKGAVEHMLAQIRQLHGDILVDDLHLRNPKTFQYIVRQVSKVSFDDSGLDTKGAAFEYFVRATLKGKRLGQYFTPRQVIDVMAGMVGRDIIVNSLLSGSGEDDDFRVVDPACGTGGFLVYYLKETIEQLDAIKATRGRGMAQSTHDKLVQRLKEKVFYGADANYGVAAAAKMNMIIAGDGHANITAEDSLSHGAETWSMDEPDCDLIVTNPPFGTAEGDSLDEKALQKYPIAGTKGQNLFLQRMVLATKPGGYICTVIDEGLLNTAAARELRAWVMQHAELLAVVRLPDETFKPNKINVRSSILLLRRRQKPDPDHETDHVVTFGRIGSLGYHGSGELIRGFDFTAFRQELDDQLLDTSASIRGGKYWDAFNVDSKDITGDKWIRWDVKYWDPTARHLEEGLEKLGAERIGDLNTITTRRGKSPVASSYFDLKNPSGG